MELGRSSNLHILGDNCCNIAWIWLVQAVHQDHYAIVVAFFRVQQKSNCIMFILSHCVS